MMDDFKFCPRCGQPLIRKHVFGAERPYCPSCGYVVFRDPKLAVGALILTDDQVLLVRRGVIPRKGFWAMPSGFVEHDEQPQSALVREIHEETGLEAEIGELVGLFPLTDPNKKGVFLLFEAHVIGGELQPGDDVTEARWFALDALPWEAMAFPQLQQILEERTQERKQ